MARQRIHDRRAGRGGGNTGASWISYSDMMAALLLVFVLILSTSLYQYFTMLETKQTELDTKQATLDQQTILLAAQQTTLDEQSAALTLAQTELDAQTAALLLAQQSLAAQEAALTTAKDELAVLQLSLNTKQDELDAATLTLSTQQAAMDAQARKIDSLVGVRSQIISELSTALTANSLRATVDDSTGDIVLDSAVFFEFGSNELRADGKALLDQFIPVYLSVLLQPEYKEYLGEIIIEGHTDTTGTYINNLKLSQERALKVAIYCLEMPGLNTSQRELLKEILTATGRSYSDPVYNADGSINMDASRRVEFKFSLKDAEMIEEMNRLLQSTTSDSTSDIE